MSDSELLHLFASEKSDTAFKELVSRRIGLVYSVALHHLGGDAHFAKDVSQIVFIDLARKAASLCQHDALLGWFYTSTRYAASKVRRSQMRHQQRELSLATLESPAPDSPPDLDSVRRVLDDVILELNARDRELLLLRFFDANRLSEVGEKLGVSENAAQKAVDRALQRMRVLLARRGITTTAAALTATICEQSAMASPAGLSQNIARQVTWSQATTPRCASLVELLRSSTFFKISIASALVGLVAVLPTLLNPSSHRLGTARSEVLSVRGAESSPLATLSQPSMVKSDSRAPWHDDGGELILAPNPALSSGIPSSSNRVNLGYDAFFLSLDLDDARRSRLQQLLGEEEKTLSDLQVVATQQGFFPGRDPASFKRLASETTAEIESEIKALLGESDYTELERYRETLAARITTEQLQHALRDSQEPLTEEQADRLAEHLAEAPPPPPPPPTPMPTGMVLDAGGDGATRGTDRLAGSRINDAVVAWANAHLTPAQFRALQHLREQQQLKRITGVNAGGPVLSAQ